MDITKKQIGKINVLCKDLRITPEARDKLLKSFFGDTARINNISISEGSEFIQFLIDVQEGKIDLTEYFTEQKKIDVQETFKIPRPTTDENETIVRLEMKIEDLSNEIKELKEFKEKFERFVKAFY